MRTTTITTVRLLLCLLCASGAAAWAQDGADSAPETSAAAAPEAVDPAAGADGEDVDAPAMEFDYRTGDVELPNKIATLHLGENYRYLNPAETERLLVAWGNQPGNETQGAIVPRDVDPMSNSGWAVIVTYEDDGHVDDSDATKIDYDEMLEDMKAGTEENNAARKKAGYGTVHLIGWAEKPHYDAATKKLYWAKELSFEGNDSNTLNYDVRVLGREGVLSMNAVASIEQLSQVKSDMKPLIQVAEFNAGHRYAEFDASTDRMAEYGLGALIAGGLAAKLGLFAKIGAFLLAFKKFIFIGMAALGGFLWNLFKKKDSAA
jgi:uncharacterized membrane-anchored protein